MLVAFCPMLLCPACSLCCWWAVLAWQDTQPRKCLAGMPSCLVGQAHLVSVVQGGVRGLPYHQHVIPAGSCWGSLPRDNNTTQFA